MSVTLVSESDTPEQMKEALASAGYGEPDAPVTEDKPDKKDEPKEKKSAPTEDKADKADAEEGKTAEDSEASEDQKQDEEDQKADTKKAGKIQKRIDELTREKYNERKARERADAEVADLKRQLTELQARLDAPKDTKTEADTEKPKDGKPVPPKRPKFNDFNGTTEEYEAALDKYDADMLVYNEKLADFKSKEAIETLERKRAEERQQEEAAKRQQEWNEKLEKAKSEIDDYEEVMSHLEEEDVDITGAFLEAMVESDLGGHIAYYLATNPDEAERIKELTYYPANASPATVLVAHRAAAREVAKIESKLLATKKSAPKDDDKAEKSNASEDKKSGKASRAPDPIEPVSTKVSPKKEKNPYDDEMTPAEYRAWKAKQAGK